MRTQRTQNTVINGDLRHDARLHATNPPQGTITRRGRYRDLQVDVSTRNTPTNNEPTE
jgi:hypothetical protein